jgi:hypothetical protein
VQAGAFTKQRTHATHEGHSKQPLTTQEATAIRSTPEGNRAIGQHHFTHQCTPHSCDTVVGQPLITQEATAIRSTPEGNRAIAQQHFTHQCTPQSGDTVVGQPFITPEATAIRSMPKGNRAMVKPSRKHFAPQCTPQSGGQRAVTVSWRALYPTGQRTHATREGTQGMLTHGTALRQPVIGCLTGDSASMPEGSRRESWPYTTTMTHPSESNEHTWPGPMMHTPAMAAARGRVGERILQDTSCASYLVLAQIHTSIRRCLPLRALPQPGQADPHHHLPIRPPRASPSRVLMAAVCWRRAPSESEEGV